MNAKTPIRTAVIGVGYLGRFHAQKHKALGPDVELLAVSDARIGVGQKVAAELQVPFEPDFRKLAAQVDAVTIAASTSSHYEIANYFLEKKIPLLIEKPLCATLEQARSLAEAAMRSGNVTCQVGHIERFNPAFTALAHEFQNMRDPRYLHASRRTPFNMRGADVDVTLDLMIHDIELALSLDASPIKKVSAVGAQVMGLGSFDEIHAWIEWESGLSAHFEASRVCSQPQRLFEVGGDKTVVRADLASRSVSKVARAVDSKDARPQFDVTMGESWDGLLEETRQFIVAIRQRTTPLVTAAQGLKAMELAFAIIESAKRSQDCFTHSC